MIRRILKPIACVLTVTMAVSIADKAFAAGFQLFEQSPSGQGEAFAGAAAVAEDASTIFYNPAGMSYLNSYQTIAGVHIVATDINFNPTHAQTGAGTQLTGGSGSAGVTTAVPNFYAMAPLDDQFRVGFGFGAPFGLETD